MIQCLSNYLTLHASFSSVGIATSVRACVCVLQYYKMHASFNVLSRALLQLLLLHHIEIHLISKTKTISFKLKQFLSVISRYQTVSGNVNICTLCIRLLIIKVVHQQL